jgi:uncharacterized protein
MRTAAQNVGVAWLEELDVDWTVQLHVTPDRLAASLKVEMRGADKDCPPQRIVDFVKKCGIQLTAKEAEELARVAETIRHGNPKPVCIAVGRAARPAVNEIKWHVSLEHKRLPEGRSRAAVDTRDVSHYVSVATGQKLCEVVSEEPVTGRDVFGEMLTVEPDPKARSEPLLTTGEGVAFADDGRTVVAQQDGCVQWKAGVLSVTRVLEVKGNVDYKTGNIEFNGEVAIQGDVLPGFKVKAAGGIKIGGMVERASLEAGQQITIKGGVAGRHLAKIKAAGPIEARYLHMICVESADNVVIHTECLESDVTAGKDVLVERGAIIGGVVRAKGNVRAGLVGSELGVATTIIAGRDNDAQKELQEAKRTLERLHDRIVNDEHAIGLFANARGGVAALSPAKQQMVETLRGQLAERQRAFAEQTERVAGLKEAFAERGGTVTINQRVYANVTVRIGEYSRTMNAEQAGPMTFYPDVHKGTLEVRFK